MKRKIIFFEIICIISLIFLINGCAKKNIKETNITLVNSNELDNKVQGDIEAVKDNGNKNNSKEENNKDKIIVNKENNYIEVYLKPKERKKLNLFFSNFSEVYLEPFEKDKIKNSELIKFGIYHNWINNFNRFEMCDNGQAKIEKKYIEESIKKYFGIKLDNHKSSEQFDYEDGYYTIQASSGESYVFTQVTKFIDNGSDYYTAYLNIYRASSGWTGDPNLSMEEWKKDDIYNAPELVDKFKAVIKKVESDNNSRYILVDYLKKVDEYTVINKELELINLFDSYNEKLDGASAEGFSYDLYKTFITVDNKMFIKELSKYSKDTIDCIANFLANEIYNYENDNCIENLNTMKNNSSLTDAEKYVISKVLDEYKCFQDLNY